MSRLKRNCRTGSIRIAKEDSSSKTRRFNAQVSALESLEARLLLSAPSTWINTGIGGTGTTYYPSINPWNHQEIWVGSDMGETFHTTDFGNNWQTPNYQSLPGSLIPQYATNANTLYGFSGGQLYKSIDGGTTWSSAGLSAPPNGFGDRGAFYVDHTGTNPNTGYDRMVALGRDNKAYLSTNSGQSWSALNGGATATWISGAFFNGSDIYLGINDYVDASNPGSDSNRGLWISHNNGGTWANFRTGLGAGEAFTSVSGVKDGSVVRFMAMTRPAAYIGNSCNTIMGGRNAPDWDVYSWNAGDASWINRDAGTDRSTDSNGLVVRGMYVMGGKSVTGPATFYFASSLDGGVDSQKVIYKTTDMGQTWTNVWLATNNQNVSTSYENANGLYMDSFSVSSNDPNYVVWTNQSAVYGTTDGGVHWAAISCDPAYRNPEGTYGPKGKSYRSSLNETSVWGLDFVDPNNVFANNTDANGTHSTDGGTSWAYPAWAPPYDGWQYNTTYKSITAPDGTVIVTVSGTHDLPADPTFLQDGYTNYGYGKNVLLISADKGATFLPILDMDDWPGRIFSAQMNGGRFQGANQANFSDAVDLYTINGNVTYGASGSWSGSATVANANSFRYLRYVAPNGSYGDVGQIEFLDAAGNPIAKRSNVAVIGGGGIYHNDTNNYNYTKAFDYYTDGSGNKTDAILGGYFRSAQANGSWVGLDLGAGNQSSVTQVKYQTANLNPMVKSIAVDPSNPNRLYMCVGGTDTDEMGGVWYSDNWRIALTGGSPDDVTWTHLNNGLNGVDSTGEPTPNGMDEDLKILNDGTLVLAYHGRTNHNGAGVWVLPAGQTTWVNRSAYFTDATHFANVDPNAPGISTDWDMRGQVTSVTIDPTDPTQNTWLASVGEMVWHDFRAGVYKTVDRGQHWMKLGAWSDFTSGAFDAAINPLNKEIFVTTNNGLFYAADSTNPTWVHVDNFPFPNPLRVYFNPFKPNDLWVTTFGNGIYHADTTPTTSSTPAAPQGLTLATAGPDQVKLSWTNLAPYGDRFVIQTSPDGVSNWTTLDTLDSGFATSCTTKPGALVAGTAYYFRIAAVNGTNYSTWAVSASPMRTDMAAASILTEGFTASRSLNGYNGWTSAGGTVTTPALSYTRNGTTLTTAGSYSAVMTSFDGSASKNITSLTTANSTAWVGFLFNSSNGDCGLKLASQSGGSTYLEIGMPWGYGQLRVWPYVGDGYGNTNIVMPANTTNFVVMKIAFGDLSAGSKDTITAYVNPTPGRSFPDTNGVSFTVDHSLIGVLNQLQLLGTGYNNTVKYDEVRIGRRFADVAPGTPSQAAPANPTGLTATAPGFNYSNRRVDLAWTNNSTGEQGFWIDCDTAAGFNSGNLKTSWAPAGSNKFSFTDLTAGTQYYFRVRPYNDGGTGTSNTASAITAGLLPTAPTNLTITSAVGTSYALAWTDSPNELTYKVEYAPMYEPDASFGEKWVTAAGSLPAGTTSYSLSIPTTDKTYVFRVSAVNSNGSSAANLASANIPSVPGNVTTVTSSSQGITVYWQDTSLSETNFEIRYSTDQANWTTYPTLAAKNATTTSIFGLSANTQYYFQVRALGEGGGVSDWSASGVGRTLSGSTIAYEGFNYNLGLMDGNNGAEGWDPSGAWSAAGGAVTSGSLGYASGGTALYSLGNKAQANGNLMIRNLASNLTGTFWLSAVFTQDSGAPSITLCDKNTSSTAIAFGDAWGGAYGQMVTTNGGYYYYSRTMLTPNVTHLLVVKIVLSSPNIRFEMYVDPTPGQASPGTALFTRTDIPLAGVGNLNQIKLNSSYGITTIWDELRIGRSYLDVAPIAQTAKPTGLSATAVSTSRIDLTWADVSGESGYHVQRSTDQINWTTINTTAANATSYSATGLSTGTRYYFRLSSFNNVGDSICSDTASQVTQDNPPAAPTVLGATAKSSTQIDLTWQDNSGNETGFYLDRATDANFLNSKVTFTLGANAVAYSDTTCLANTAYYYRIRAYNTGGPSANTTTATATTPSAIMGDANGDGAVNFSDYLILEQTFNGPPESPTRDADFDNNGTVNFSDYLILEQNFNTSASMAALSTALDSGSEAPAVEPMAMVALDGGAAPDQTAAAPTALPGLLDNQPVLVPTSVFSIQPVQTPPQQQELHRGPWRHMAQRARLSASPLADPLAKWEQLWQKA